MGLLDGKVAVVSGAARDEVAAAFTSGVAAASCCDHRSIAQVTQSG
jgi:hypothetical protein